MSARVTMICRDCGSTDVKADAYASWNVTTQAWEIIDLFDKGAYCGGCDGDTRLEEAPCDADGNVIAKAEGGEG